MTVMLLLAAGAFFALLLIFNNLLRAAQGRDKVSFFETLLAFLALLLPLLALVQNHAADQPLVLVNRLIIGASLVVIVASVMTLLIERRKPARSLSQMRGVLGIGVGLLLIAATFVVPVASTLVTVPTLAAQPEAASSSDTADDVVNVANPGAVNPQNPARTTPTTTPNVVLMQMSATPTRLPSLTPTPTHTPFVLVSPTPGATLVGTQPDTQENEIATVQFSNCSALVTRNLNLRGGPGTDYELLLTIPFDSVLTLNSENEGNWWQATYDGKTGWVNGDYLTFSGDCPNLPAPTVAPTQAAAQVCQSNCEDDQADNRVNPGAAEAAVYCTARGVKIVDLDISGVSTGSFTVPHEDITAVGIPAENTLIQEYQGFRLYRLTTGELQLNAPPNWRTSGEYVFTWAGCDQTAVRP